MIRKRKRGKQVKGVEVKKMRMRSLREEVCGRGEGQEEEGGGEGQEEKKGVKWRIILNYHSQSIHYV